MADHSPIDNVLLTLLRPRYVAHKLALPLDSKGNMMQISPAAMNKAPLVYTGALVLRFPAMAMIGAMIPKIRLVVAVRAFPVPLSFVGKISGV